MLSAYSEIFDSKISSTRPTTADHISRNRTRFRGKSATNRVRLNIDPRKAEYITDIAGGQAQDLGTVDTAGTVELGHERRSSNGESS